MRCQITPWDFRANSLPRVPFNCEKPKKSSIVKSNVILITSPTPLGDVKKNKEQQIVQDGVRYYYPA